MGQAWSKSGIKREHVFLTSKVHPRHLGYWSTLQARARVWGGGGRGGGAARWRHALGYLSRARALVPCCAPPPRRPFPLNLVC